MAKIDTSTIPGYEEMSAEDKIKALEGFEYEEPKADTAAIDKLKAQLSKANSESADWKRQLREKQTEQERAEAERAERDKDLLEQLNAYKTKDRISSYTAKLMSAGYDAESAAKMASGLPDGIDDSFFAEQKKFIDAQKKAVENATIDKQTNLTAGSSLGAKTIEDANLAAFRKAAFGT